MASGSITITPGLTVTDATPIAATELNQIATPVAQLDEQSVGPEHIVMDELIEELGSGAAGYNYLDNGNFAENRWSRGATATSAPAGTRTYRADQWWCQPQGAAVNYERSESGPDTKSVHSALLTGATSVTTVDFGQDIPRRLASALKFPLVLSFYLWNGTGAVFSPTVRLNTPAIADDFSAVVNRLSTSPADTATASAWTKFELALDCSALPDIEKGLQVVIRIPNGRLADGSQTVRFSQCKLEILPDVPATAFYPEREAEEETADTGLAPFQPNLWINGHFAGDRFLYPGTSGPTVSAGVHTPNAEGWWVNAAGGATLTYTRDTAVPNNRVAYSAKLTGGAGVNAVGFGQNFDPSRAAGLRADMIVSAWLLYTGGSGATTSPRLKLDTCDSYGSFGALTNRLDVPLGSLADGAGWVQVSYQFDGSGLTNIGNGCRLYVEFPSGDMDSSSKIVNIAEALLQRGTVVNDLEPYIETGLLALIGAQRDLKIEGGGSGVLPDGIGGTAEMIVLENLQTGEPFIVRNFSATADITVTGAGGRDAGTRDLSSWYFIYIIGTGGATAFLLSKSATAPTMPAGYIYRALVGAVYNNGSNILKKFRQVGRIVHQESPAADFVSSTSFAAVSLTAQVPSIARLVWGSISKRSGGDLRVQVAFDSSGNGAMPLAAAAVGSPLSGDNAAAFFQCAIDTSATQIFVKASNASDYRVTVCGFEMNLP